MNNTLISWVEAQSGLKERTQPAVGSQIKVSYRIREGEKERVQVFEGTVIACRHGSEQLAATFTVRKMSQDFGVERTFPLHSPLIEKIVFVRQGRVRRAKLYYLRHLRGKRARLREVRG